VKHWASVYVDRTVLLVPFTELQFIAFFPLVGNLAFLLFDGGESDLSLSWTVGSASALCSMEREAS
jgi:hypothetical protein